MFTLINCQQNTSQKEDVIKGQSLIYAFPITGLFYHLGTIFFQNYQLRVNFEKLLDQG